MCGICGVAGRYDEALVCAMTDAIAHRGPDGSGVKGFESRDGHMPATLGHRRLSIIDVSARGAQPMGTADGRYWITYNGEVYNFAELRSELRGGGVQFRSGSDTEVVLALYARDGPAMVSRLNGIFAFAVWDSVRAELFLARDRLGVKPLYYAEYDGALWFGSEVKALLPALPRPRLNPRVVSEYLTFLWVPDPDTMFDGIHKLPPGHTASYAGGRLRIEPYWDWAFAPEQRSEEAWVGDVRDTVAQSIRRQMVSDVPLGSFLSGGLDSSAIVAEMTAAHVGRVSTYTVGLSQDDLAHDVVSDDVRYAREMAQRFDIDYHESILEADVVDLLPRLIWHMDEPVADPAAITTYLICRAAREQLTVILSGMGGDEIFAGYPRHLAARIARATDVVPPFARAGVRRAVQRHMTLGKPGRTRALRRNALKFVRGFEDSWQDRYLTHVSYYQREEVERLLSDELRAAGGHDPFHRHREYFDRVRDEHWLNQILYVDLKTFLPCLNLAYTDKMSMATSTEVRVPLLDNELLDLSARIPPELKLRGTKRKYVFKRSQEGLLPDSVIWRPKAGFTAPIRAWLVGDLREMVNDLLSPEVVASRGLFDPAEVQRLIRNNEQAREDNALRIWTLMTLELWQQTFVDAPASPASPSMAVRA